MSEGQLGRLARKMVYLERAANLAQLRGKVIDAEVFRTAREQVATDRSQLMRDLWAKRRARDKASTVETH